jgi:hypothetical protein
MTGYHSFLCAQGEFIQDVKNDIIEKRVWSARMSDDRFLYFCLLAPNRIDFGASRMNADWLGGSRTLFRAQRWVVALRSAPERAF